MPKIKELLNEKDFKRMAELLNLQEEELAKLSLEDIKKALMVPDRYSPADLKYQECNYFLDIVMQAIDNNPPLTETDSLGGIGALAPTPIVQTSADDASFTLITIKGKDQSARNAIAEELDAEYQKITKLVVPKPVVYKKGDKLPPELRHLTDYLSKENSISVITYTFSNKAEAAEFKKMLVELQKAGKIKYTKLPQQTDEQELSTGAQEEERSSLAPRR